MNYLNFPERIQAVLQQTDFLQWKVAPSLHWMEAFGAWLHEHDRMPKTIEAYLQDLRHYSRYFGELNAMNVKTYFAMQDADNTVKPSSRNRRLASLRVFVEWAVEMGLMDADPTVSVRRVKFELSPRNRTADEMKKLESVAVSHEHLKCKTQHHSLLGLRDELIWNLFKHAGLRIHEIAGLKICDVDMQANVIRVLGKGAKKADVIVPQRLIDVIASWIKHAPVSFEGYLVTDWNGHSITTSQVRRRVQLMGETCGVKQLRPHDLRHTYVYDVLDTMLMQGINMPVALDAARKQARHGDAKTTMMYLRARDSQIRAAVEAM